MFRLRPFLSCAALATIFASYGTVTERHAAEGGDVSVSTSTRSGSDSTREASGTAANDRDFQVRRHIAAGGVERSYALFVPRGRKPSQKLPVLMFLNGQNENGNDGVRQISNNFGIQLWEIADVFPFIAVAPQCRAGSSWSADSDDSRWAMEILDAVIDEFDADEDRICLTGVSSGGIGAWSVAAAYSERFAAVAPLCGVGGDATRLCSARLPVWFFVNDRDAASLVDSSRARRQALLRCGLSPLFTEFDSDGHDCWNRVYRMPALYRWLLEQRRTRNMAQPMYDYLPPARLLTDWEQHGGGTWSILDEDVVTASASREDGLLVAPHASRAFELHADLWLAGSSARELVLLDDATGTATESLRIAFVLPDAGAGGVYRPGAGAWLSPLDPAAERSLRPNAWNDVRVTLQGGRLGIRLNGWTAADVVISETDAAQAAFRGGLVAPADAAEVRWRYVRTRDLTGNLNSIQSTRE